MKSLNRNSLGQPYWIDSVEMTGLETQVFQQKLVANNDTKKYNIYITDVGRNGRWFTVCKDEALQMNSSIISSLTPPEIENDSISSITDSGGFARITVVTSPSQARAGDRVTMAGTAFHDGSHGITAVDPSGTFFDIDFAFGGIEGVVGTYVIPSSGDRWRNETNDDFEIYRYDDDNWVTERWDDGKEYSTDGIHGSGAFFHYNGTAITSTHGPYFKDNFKIYSFTLSNENAENTGNLRIWNNGVNTVTEAFDLSLQKTQNLISPIIFTKEINISSQLTTLSGDFLNPIIQLNMRKVYVP